MSPKKSPAPGVPTPTPIDSMLETALPMPTPTVPPPVTAQEDAAPTAPAPALAPAPVMQETQGQLADILAMLKEQNASLAAQRKTNQILELQLAEQAEELKQMRAAIGAGEPQPVDQNPDIQEGMCYVRLKPRNPKSGYFRGRMRLTDRALGIVDQIFDGGDGRPGGIPIWYPFPEKKYELLRRGLAKHHQKPYDMNSRAVFDVVTADERREIDAAEETMRMAVIGVGSPDQIRKDGIRARTAHKDGYEERQAIEPPSMAEGASAFKSRRAAALDGLEPSASSADSTPPRRRGMRQHTVSEAKPAPDDLTTQVDDRLADNPELAGQIAFARKNPLPSLPK